jgi:predicted TIM-barrel fold metal-dependent hydrolase
MAGEPTGRVVDADGHVLEPADTWLRYIDPSYRDRAIRIGTDPEGYEVLLIDGRSLKTLRGQLGSLGGIEMDTERLLTRGQVTYAEGSPAGGYDPRARLAVMDAEGIDSVLLYPTIGICWEGHVTDPGLATAYTRAYNRWLVEFCQADRTRLHPVAHISLLDPEGAVEETIRARAEGCVGVFLSPDVAARGGRHFDDPAFARFWATVQDLEMPIAFHVVVRDRQWFRPWQRYDPSDGLFGFAFLAIDVMAAFTQMLASGMFERYPRLRCAVLEAGSNWIASWLDRLDTQAPRDGAPHADPHGAERVLLPPVPDLGRSGRVPDRPDGRAPRGRLLHLGLGLPAHRRLDGRGARAAGAARAAARRGATEGARGERAAVLPAVTSASLGRSGESGGAAPFAGQRGPSSATIRSACRASESAATA